jgi:hypothetical protein
MAKRSVDIETKRKLANYTLRWCKKNMGINKRKAAPKISVRMKVKDEDGEWYGIYIWEENKIVISLEMNKTMKDIVSTVIHEYTHYLQSMKKYYEYFNTYYYSTHPYEKQAIKNSKVLTDKCLYNFRKSIY